MIDPHVHCRDWTQSHKETIAHALSIAERAGLSGIFDMPNTDPAITSSELVKKRLEDARKCHSKVFYGLYIGLTSDKNQIKEAVDTWKEYFPHVVGLKMFAGKSVGNLAVINEDEQRNVYRSLVKYNYSGILAVHCEKESLMRPELFDSENNPRTHSYARPPESEIESVKDQIKFAEEERYEGGLHICHVSVPESVDIINNTKNVSISCGVTPHHCMLSYELIPVRKQGLIYKVNPPLRCREHSEKMVSLLKSGKIDFIETDHAPHTLEDKLEKQMSGFPGIPFYPSFIKQLHELYDFSEKQIQELTHKNIESIFNIKIPLLNIKPNFNLEKEYEFDVYTLK